MIRVAKVMRPRVFAKSPWEKTLQRLQDQSQRDATLLVDPKTHQHYNMVRAAIAKVRPKFKGNHLMAADIIINALQIADDLRARPKIPYRGTRPTWQGMGRKVGAGRPDHELLRIYLFSALTRAWILGFGKLPKINQKRNPLDSPFVVFAKTILRHLGIQNKMVDYIDHYRSYKRALRRGVQYSQWQELRKSASLFAQGGAMPADQ